MSLELVCMNYGSFHDARSVVNHCRHLMAFDKVSLFHPMPFQQNGINVQQLHSKNQNIAAVKEFPDLITCDHALSVQWDGFIINPQMWENSWLQYDWIGAPWDLTNLPNPMWRVGCGGFVLFSKRMAMAWKNICNTDENVDWQIGALYRDKFEAMGLKYAPLEVAIDFAKEVDCGDLNVAEDTAFGFHSFEYGNGYRDKYKKLVFGETFE